MKTNLDAIEELRLLLQQVRGRMAELRVLEEVHESLSFQLRASRERMEQLLADNGARLDSALRMELALIENGTPYLVAEHGRLTPASSIDQLPGIFFLLDADGRVLRWNRCFERVSGYSPEQIAELPALAFVADIDHGLVHDKIKECLNRGFASIETRLRDSDGLDRTYFISLSRSTVEDRPCIVAVGVDFTDRKEEENRLRSLSMTDDLTGLLNRRGFFAMARQLLFNARRNEQNVVLLFADVDNLKYINDTRGHREGDRALMEVARVLLDTFREADVIGRLGGDEYAVLATHSGESADSAAYARLSEKIRHSSFPAQRAGDVPLSLSVGQLVVAPGDDRSLDELIAQADERMYVSKQARRT